jgi:anti-sigma factor RsiW
MIRRVDAKVRQMNCEEADHLLDAYLDRELDPGQAFRLEQHLSDCPICRSLERESRDFRSFFRSNAPIFTAPPQLKANVLAAVGREHRKSFLLRRPWIYAAAVIVLGLSVPMILLPDQTKQLSAQAILSHSESLDANHLVDIASSDQKTIGRWFAARIGFTPPVINDVGSGFSLLGGRTETIQNRTVAALIYKNGADVVSLFCWPSNHEQIAGGNYFIDGCNVAVWSNKACNYIVVSMSDKRTFDAFVEVLRGRTDSGLDSGYY